MFTSLIKVVKFTLICAMLGVCGLAGIIYYYNKRVPEYSQLASYNPPATTRIYTMDGKLIEEYSAEYRIFVPIASIPNSLINAFIAAEDKNFRTHGGIDFTRLLKVVVTDISAVFSNRRVQGASTITQQVVKNFLLTSERSLSRKIKEAILAYKVSKVFTKDQILELYLNQIYLGEGAYGVAAAAQIYFDKSIDNLSVGEMAVLAALPKAPSAHNPRKNLARMTDRRNYVISRMLEDGYIDATVAQQVMSEEIVTRKRSPNEIVPANYYAEHVRNEVIGLLSKKVFYEGGLTIVTCLDSSYQSQAEAAMRKAIREYDHRYGYRGPIGNIALEQWPTKLKQFDSVPRLAEYKPAVVLQIKSEHLIIGLAGNHTSQIPLQELKWAGDNLKKLFKIGDIIVVERVGKHHALRQIPAVDGGMMVVNYSSGQVLAMVGGYDFSSSKFNRVTQAQRQPGSAIKPFVYLAALEQGIEPNTIFFDQAIEISPGKGLPLWRPKNIKGDFLGPITMRRGLELSRNLVTIRVGQAAGIDNFLNVLKRLGICANPGRHYPAMLGALETTLEKLTNGYAILARGGQALLPQYIEMIKDRNGKILYRRNTQAYLNPESLGDIPVFTTLAAPQLIDDGSAYQVTSMLEGVFTRGTARSASHLRRTLAGKTGTTNNNMDTWFIGYAAHPQIVVGTYIGHDNPSSLGSRATGATVALPAFIDFMSVVAKGQADAAFAVPSSIVLKRVDPHSGYLSSTPGAIQEAFKVSVSAPPSLSHEIEPQEIESQIDSQDDVFKSLQNSEDYIQQIEAGEFY